MSTCDPKDRFSINTLHLCKILIRLYYTQMFKFVVFGFRSGKMFTVGNGITCLYFLVLVCTLASLLTYLLSTVCDALSYIS